VWVELLNDAELLDKGITIEPKAQVVKAVKESEVIAFNVVGTQGDVISVARFRASGLGIAYEIEVGIQVTG